MRFLALSPLAATVLAVLTTALLVAMYFLKLHRRKIQIASSMLWSRVLDRHEERSFWEKLRRILSVLFVVIIGLLIAFAVARPEIGSLTGATGRTLIVMDSSPTMRTRMSDGRSRWQHAGDLAKALVASGGSGTEFRIADTSGQFDTPFTSDTRQLQGFIATLRPMAAPPVFPESTDPSDANTETYFISDGVAMPDVPKTVKTMIVYETARNAGITAFEVRPMPPGLAAAPEYEAYLEVTNFGSDALKTEINIHEGGRGRITREVQIPAGQSYNDIFDLSTFEGGGVRATIHSAGDALAEDDVAYTYLPLRKKTKVLLVTEGNPYLQTALKLAAFVDLSVVDPKVYQDNPPRDGTVDVFIFDRYAPPVQPSKPAMVIGMRNGNKDIAQTVPQTVSKSVRWLPGPGRAVTKPVFTTWIESHPVMQYLSLHDVSITAASTTDLLEKGASAGTVQGTVLAASGQTPLIVASPVGAPGARWILLTFDLQSSDFPLHESFPIFIDNSLAWFGRDRLALRRTTGIVEIPIDNAQITGPDGKALVSQAYLDRTVFEAHEPGLYVATTDGLRQYIAVNLMGRLYSNINHPAPKPGIESPPPARFLRREPWFYFLFLAVLFLGVEWFTYHRRITL